jgi:hypothetical protein
VVPVENIVEIDETAFVKRKYNFVSFILSSGHVPLPCGTGEGFLYEQQLLYFSHFFFEIFFSNTHFVGCVNS